MNQVLANYIVNAPNDQQAIIPEINFTCNGTIRTWIIGGQWRNNGENNIELQIWRRNENGLCDKVESSEIHVTERNATGLYWYHLPTHLPFQAGDILGFYQPSQSRLRLRLAVRVDPLQTVYSRDGNPDTEFPTTASSPSRNVLVIVETGKFLAYYIDIKPSLTMHITPCVDHPECESGFMSVETMYTLVGLGEVGRFTGYNQRQQITPNITFTCDGWITKWIIGALWNGGNMLFPELQIWRNDGNDTYRKINGTFISVETRNASLIYEYSNFPPIPFQAGDILGAFVPQGSLSKLKLRSERGHGHLNYYISTNVDTTESPYESIDLSETVSRATYHPMVSVEISKYPLGLELLITITTTYIKQSTYTTAVTSSVTLSPSTQVHSTDEVDATLYVSIGVSGAVVVLIATAVIGICVCIIMYLRKRQVKLVNISVTDTTDNVTYGTSKNEMKLSDNVAYSTTKSASSKDENTYDYVPVTVSTTDGNGIITTSPNEAYAATGNVPVSSNQAYGMVHH